MNTISISIHYQTVKHKDKEKYEKYTIQMWASLDCNKTFLLSYNK
jgi:hypothetical protein